MGWIATHRDRLTSLFGAYYPPDTVRAILRLIRPALRLTSAETRLGGSRLGGPALLPPGLAWPRWAGRRLDFLAVVDFAETARVLSLPELPGTGAACFYYAAEIPRPWGDDPAERDGWRVLHATGVPATPTDAGAGVTGRVGTACGTESETGAGPGTGDETARAGGRGAGAGPATGAGGRAETISRLGSVPGAPDRPVLPLAAEPFLSLPGPYEPSLRMLDGTWNGFLDVYEQLYEAWLRFVWADLPRHQLAGWPVLIQRPLGEDQRLLLQLDSDERLGRCWGDPGTVYFHARAADLRSGALDRCRLTLQAR